MTLTYFSNRASAVFAAALAPLGGELWQPDSKTLDLLYFDAFGGKQAPVAAARRRLFDRKLTIPLDHKRLMAERLMGHLEFPRHFLDQAQVPHEPGTLWYVKDPLSSGGNKVWLCEREELDAHFRPGYVIQEAVQDVALFDGRKYTLRTYVLVHANQVFWYPDSFLVVHEKPYATDTKDPAVHYRHAGYMSGGVQLLPSSRLPGYGEFDASIVGVLQTVFSLFGRQLGSADASGYCLFGLDLLPRTDGSVALVEINDRPNLLHTMSINDEVNAPMLQAMAHVLLPEQIPAITGKCFENVLAFV